MPPRRSRVSHEEEDDASSTSSSTSSLENYTLSFGSLTISQLHAPPATKKKFHFRAAEKAIALHHLLTHAYTDKLPPSSLSIFLDLATAQIPVPRDQGLHVIETCLLGLEGLVTSVVKVLEGNGLMHQSVSRKNVNTWVVDVSKELIEWTDRKGGWDVVKLPSSSPKSLARQHRERGSGYTRMENRGSRGSLSTWTELRREAMDFFARQQISRLAVPAAAPRFQLQQQQQQLQQQQPLGQAQTNRSFYTASTYTTLPLRDRINQRKCYRVFLNYVRRTQQALADGDQAGREVLDRVVKSVSWNQQSLEFVRGNDYVQWQFKMCKDGLLIPGDFRDENENEDEDREVEDGEDNGSEEDVRAAGGASCS